MIMTLFDEKFLRDLQTEKPIFGKLKEIAKMMKFICINVPKYIM
jgi:hypothetical protein